MHQELSKRQRVVCCIIAFCASAAYVGAFLVYIRTTWGRKEGDFQPVPSWADDFSSDLILFPFGFVPAFDGIWVLIANILFWSALSVMIYVLFCRRKVAA
jgi:hypothetical protein